MRRPGDYCCDHCCDHCLSSVRGAPPQVATRLKSIAQQLERQRAEGVTALQSVRAQLLPPAVVLRRCAAVEVVWVCLMKQVCVP